MVEKLQIKQEVKEIMSILKNSGYEAYVVGGCTRDCLLGNTPKDWDIATNATPDKVKEVFKNYKIIETGRKHGTVLLMYEGSSFEITTYRGTTVRDKDNNLVRSFSKYISSDLRARDFTINALACDINYNIIDEHGGRNDLENKIIRAVGNPDDRFTEDPLRIMRAVRIAVELGFTIEKNTVDSMWKNGYRLENVSFERKRDELLKILRAISLTDRYDGYYESNRMMVEYLIKRIIPEFIELALLASNSTYHYADVFTHTMDALFHQKHVRDREKDDIVLLAILLHDIGKKECRRLDEVKLVCSFKGHEEYSVKIADVILRRMRVDNKTIDSVLKIIKLHDCCLIPVKKVVKQVLREIGVENYKKLITVQMMDKKAHRSFEYKTYEYWEDMVLKFEKLCTEVIQEQEAFRIRDMKINGHDLIALGIEPGNVIGLILNKCLEYCIENPNNNTKEKLTKFAEKVIRESNFNN